jgi:hypothetical protein
MSTLNEFIASVRDKGLMTTNRFSVEFALPSIIRTIDYLGDLRTVAMQCEGLTLPGMSISTQQARTYGEFREMPYERTFDNITMTFMVDNSMDSKFLFDTWINSIQDPVTRQFNYYNEYTTDIDIFVDDRDDESRYNVKLYECYPKSVAQINMDYASRDVMKLQVSMNYRYWRSDKVIEGSSGLVVNQEEIIQQQPQDDPFNDSAAAPNFNVETNQVYPRF